MATLADIRRYVRNVLELDDLTNNQCDEHIRQAFRKTVDYDDWPMLLTRRVFTAATDVDDRPLFPVTGQRVRSVHSVFLLDAFGFEEKQLAFVPFTDAIASGGFTLRDFPATSWTYRAEQTEQTSSGNIYIWPAFPHPEVTQIASIVVLQGQDWPQPTTPSAGEATVDGVLLPSGLVTAVKYLALAEAAVQVASGELHGAYTQLGMGQLEAEKSNSYPIANAELQLGGVSRPSRVFNARYGRYGGYGNAVGR